MPFSNSSDKVAKNKNTKLLTLADTQIMSVGDFRKLTGKATSSLSDTQVKEIIQQLDFLAELYFKSVPAESELPM